MFDKATPNRAREAVKTYSTDHNRSPEFKVSEVLSITAEERPTCTVPFATRQGCYLFYAEDGTLLYVGKTSWDNTIAGRVLSYFRTLPAFPVRHEAGQLHHGISSQLQ